MATCVFSFVNVAAMAFYSGRLCVEIHEDGREYPARPLTSYVGGISVFYNYRSESYCNNSTSQTMERALDPLQEARSGLHEDSTGFFIARPAWASCSNIIKHGNDSVKS